MPVWTPGHKEDNMKDTDKPKDFDKTGPELRRLLSLATPDQKYLILGFIRGLLGGRGNG